MTEETVSVSRSVDLSADPREVWARIGDFDALDTWHPLVKSCRPEHAADLHYRHLVTVDGGEFTEQLLGQTGHGYHYRINSSPLPVDHYESHLRVVTHGAGTRVIWSSSFTPTGPGAAETVAQIYEAGLDALKKMYG